MTDTKLTNLLRALSSDEFRQLEKFIDSPYYNKGRDLMPFFKMLKTFYPDFSSKNLTNEFIYKKLFPGKQFDSLKCDTVIRALASHLFSACKEFLVQLELELQQTKKKYFLLSQLRRKKLYKEFDKEYNSIADDDGGYGKGSVRYFVDKYLTSAVKRDCSLDRDDFVNSFEFTLQASESISVAALISLYKFEDEKNHVKGYHLTLRNNILDLILENFDGANFIEELKSSDLQYYPYIQIFSGIYMMNHYKDNEEYYKVKELLKEHSSLFGQPENYALWNTLLTYSNLNHLGRRENLELCKHMLDNKIHKPLPSENFHIVLFRNIVLLGSQTDEFDWLEKFIEQYSPELHENHRESMKVYSLAHLSFARSDFEKALEYILKIKYNLWLYKLDMKILQLRIYYELGYHEEALSLISTIVSYLNESKEVSKVSKEYTNVFIKCLRDLIKLRSNGGHKESELHEMNVTLNHMSDTGLSRWLLEKVKELRET
ncbi:MAG: hypothetical protein ABI462_04155 [Ignavibacteria bacterium]